MSIESTIRQLVNNACTKLNWSSTPRLDAELLLAHVLKKDRTYIATNPKKTVSPLRSRRFGVMISQRRKKVPLAYIIGEKEFYGFDFKVTKDTLIPRPETEIIIDKAIEVILEKAVGSVVDIGTGSGCIILSIAKTIYTYNPSLAQSIKWIATDISEDARKIARENYVEMFADNEVPIDLLRGNLLSPVQERVDLIISNPPYIPQLVYATLEANVRMFEPKCALLGGPTGTEIIQLLFTEAKEKLNVGGTILLEMHYDQATAVSKLAKQSFPNATAEIVKDYAGLNRIAIIRT